MTYPNLVLLSVGISLTIGIIAVDWIERWRLAKRFSSRQRIVERRISAATLKAGQPAMPSVGQPRTKERASLAPAR